MMAHVEHTKEKALLVWGWRVCSPFTCNDPNTEGCRAKMRKWNGGGGTQRSSCMQHMELVIE